jgi:hypothetical protein
MAKRDTVDTSTLRKLAVEAGNADPRSVKREILSPGSVRGEVGRRIRAVLERHRQQGTVSEVRADKAFMDMLWALIDPVIDRGDDPSIVAARLGLTRETMFSVALGVRVPPAVLHQALAGYAALHAESGK